MKSKRAAVVNSARKHKSRKKMKKKTSQFMICDDWDHDPYGDYDCLEHSRWATVLNFLGMKFAYQAETIGCTYDLVMKPTFFLNDTEEWLHLCRKEPSKLIVMTASMVAEATQKPMSVVQGPMFVPDIDAPADKHFAMPLWHTRGEGHSVIRYLCEVRRDISIKYTTNILDCTTKRICAAFRRGCAVSRLPDHRSESRYYRSRRATETSGVA